MLTTESTVTEDYEYIIDAEDYSDIPFINVIWIVKPFKDVAPEFAAILPVVILGVLGNFLLLFTLFSNRQLQTPTNLMIGNMAFADMLSLLIHPWVYIVTYDMFQNYILGPFGCKSEAALECAILISSVMSLSVISYDRLSLIVLPSTGINMRKAKICMVATWLSGLILSTPLIIFRKYKERQWKDFLETFCVEEPIIIEIYWPTIITVLVWLPLTILIVCYISIFFKLRQFEKVVLEKALNHQKKVSYRKKAARMMFIVIVTFMACRLPFTAMIFVRYARFTGKSAENINNVYGFYSALLFISKYLIFVNAALNPIIYGITNEKFRRAFKNSKLTSWMFPKKTVVHVVPNTPKNKSTDTIFFIFKRKLKSKGEST